MMRPALAIFAAALFTCSSVQAETALLPGGVSPNKKIEIRIFKADDREPSNYFYGIVDSKTHKRMGTLDVGGGIDHFQDAKSNRVLWHPSSRFFVLTDSGTRHSQEIYLYEIRDSKIHLIELPDYVQNALGRVGGTEIDLRCVTSPTKWDDDLLACSLAFNTSLPAKGLLEFQCQFVLRLFQGPFSQSFVRLQSMAKPRLQ